MAPPKSFAALPMISIEFYKLYKWLRSSPYFTDNDETACVKISNIDFLVLSNIQHGLREIGQFISSGHYWRQGQNTIFPNFLINSDLTNLPTERGMIASADFRHSNIRLGFDIPISYYSELISFLNPLESIDKDIPLIAELDYRGDILEHILPLFDGNDTYPVTAADYQNFDTLEMVLSRGKFCLVTYSSSDNFQNRLFSLGLKFECIPVVVGDDKILPFEPFIDWSLAVVRVSIVEAGNIMNTISKLTSKTIKEKRHYGKQFYEKYFSSMAVIGQSTLTFLQQIIYPRQSATYEEWNGLPLVRTKLAPFIQLDVAEDKGFTAVILTYNRLQSLWKVVQNLSQAKNCRKILIIWNDQERLRPQIDYWPETDMPVQIIKTFANKLTNRFFPFKVK